jgi:hypothetical protein
MNWTRLPGEIRRRPIWERIDHAAELMNPLLVVAAALLALINLSVYSAFEIARRYPPHPVAEKPADPPTVAPGHLVVSPPTQG